MKFFDSNLEIEHLNKFINEYIFEQRLELNVFIISFRSFLFKIDLKEQNGKDLDFKNSDALLKDEF